MHERASYATPRNHTCSPSSLHRERSRSVTTAMVGAAVLVVLAGPATTGTAAAEADGGGAAVTLVPGDSIQSVIDDPATMNGDVIVLTPGTYVETIDFRGLAIELRSLNPKDPAIVAATVIDGDGAGSVLTFRSGEGATTVINGLTITGGLAASGGGAYIEFSAPTFLRCTFVGNEAQFEGGGVFCLESDARLVNCRLVGNTALFGGGLSALFASPEIVNTVFTGNTAGASGGGVDAFNDGQPRLVNCTFTANTAPAGASLSSDGSRCELANCILWGDGGTEVQAATSDAASFSHCIVAGSGGSAAWDGTLGTDLGGNLDTDPVFVDAVGADGTAGTVDDDLRLVTTSPAIDAGRNDGVGADFADVDGDGDRNERLPLDLADAPRFADRSDAEDTGEGLAPLVDLGAYEAPGTPNDCPYDLDGDGWVGGHDLQILFQQWRKDPNGFDLQTLLELLSAWGPCNATEAAGDAPSWRDRRSKRGARRWGRHR